LSLKEKTPPTPIDIPTDSNVEMTWQVFGGEHNELYLALLKQRCKNDGLDVGFDTLNRQLRLHLHRGIGYMAVHGFIKRVDDLVRLTKAT
jgi:DNA sulfur modification protein DndE